MTVMPPEEYARRLVRARNWHLQQAGFQRRSASAAIVLAEAEVRRHEAEADRLARQIRELGLAPQPPETAA